MAIYKTGQGKVVRLCAFVGLILIVLLGCMTIWDWPEEKSWWRESFELAGISLEWIALLAAGVFLLAGSIVFWVLCRPQ